MDNKNYILIAIAGSLWGTLGLFGSLLMNIGLLPEQVAFCRLFFGSLILIIYACIKTPETLKIKRRGLIYSLILGFISQAMFNITYFNAIKEIGIAASAVLLYTAPVFLAIFSKIFYKEYMGITKIVSLLLCFGGSFIAATGCSLDIKILNIPGILLGTAAAVAYALMPIFSKSALKSVNAMTLTIYSFIFGAMFMIPLSRPWEIIKYASNIKVLLLMFGLGLIPSALSYLCYMSGILKGVELSRAGIISSVELIVAVAIAWFVMGENFSIAKFSGILIMLVSIVISSRNALPSKGPSKTPVKKTI